MREVYEKIHTGILRSLHETCGLRFYLFGCEEKAGGFGLITGCLEELHEFFENKKPDT